MRLTRPLRKLLEGYLVGLATLVGIGGAGLALGGGSGSLLDNAVVLGLFVAMGVWLAVAYFAGASPETYLRPDESGIVLATQSSALVLPQDSPEVMQDLKEKLVGSQSDIMMWAGGNAGLCFVLGILFHVAPLPTVVALGIGSAAIATLLVRSR